MDAKIWELSRADSRFAYEAYEFVCEAVTHTQDTLGRTQTPDDDGEDRHITAAELLRGVCQLAITEFGMMASVVFKQWGIRETMHIGEIVARLVGIEKLSQSENDDFEEFRNAFDLEEALSLGFELIPANVATARKTSR